MLFKFLPTVLTSLVLKGVAASPVISQRWYPSGSCVTDVKIEPCTDFGCRLDGYHRIDSFLNQAENTTQWNYVFYKTEDSISASCVTEIKIVEEGGAAPQGADWYASPHTAHYGISPGGGPQLYSRRNLNDQLAGKVVDLVVVRPGRWANGSEPFIRERVNLGLGEKAGTAEYADYKEYDAVSSGWVYLEYTLAGPRSPITQIKLVACGENTLAGECGDDMVAEGWHRRDLNLNGPTANGSTIYLLTSTVPTDTGDCVSELKVVGNNTSSDVLDVNVNDGTNGTSLYLQVVRSGDQSNCITSIVPVDTSLYLEIPGYDVVKDESGSAADLNHGVHLADPIYVYISKDPLPYQPDPVSLSFNSTGGFRIAHFSDLHFGNVAGTCQDVPEAFKQNCSETFSFTFMERALDLLKPDMVIINGDLYANLDKKADDGSYPQLTRGAMQKAIFPIIERGIPFATTWGNHDAEGDLLREELQMYISQQPGYVGSRGLPELDGMGNYQVDIVKSDESDEIAHRLWFFDSRSYTYLGVNGSTSGAYGGVEKSQIDWYSESASQGPNVSAMAFFHIPLAEIAGVQGNLSRYEVGVHGEPVCSQGHDCTDTPGVSFSSDTSVSLFEAFVKAGDVKATFSGHDHENDYALKVQNITMTYDGSAGYNAYSAGDPNYNREMRCIDIVNYGATAISFKVIDDIFQGTVHRNESEPILTLF